jgi:hypothetical protein
MLSSLQLTPSSQLKHQSGVNCSMISQSRGRGSPVWWWDKFNWGGLSGDFPGRHIQIIPIKLAYPGAGVLPRTAPQSGRTFRVCSAGAFLLFTALNTLRASSLFEYHVDFQRYQQSTIPILWAGGDCHRSILGNG